MDRVRVSKEKPSSACGLKSAMDSVALPCPSATKWRGVKQIYRWKAKGSFTGPVGGIVINDDDFKADTGLAHQRRQTMTETGFLVSRRDNHRNHWFPGTIRI